MGSSQLTRLHGIMAAAASAQVGEEPWGGTEEEKAHYEQKKKEFDALPENERNRSAVKIAGKPIATR
jgi:hypothetical protein